MRICPGSMWSIGWGISGPGWILRGEFVLEAPFRCNHLYWFNRERTGSGGKASWPNQQVEIESISAFAKGPETTQSRPLANTNILAGFMDGNDPKRPLVRYRVNGRSGVPNRLLLKSEPQP